MVSVEIPLGISPSCAILLVETIDGGSSSGSQMVINKA